MAADIYRITIRPDSTKSRVGVRSRGGAAPAPAPRLPPRRPPRL